MLSKRLRAARTANKWTQEQLARRVNTTKATISNYENNHSTPSNEMLASLARELDVTTDYLLGSSVDSKRTIRGEEVDTSELSENQRLVLDWAMQQEALSFHSQDELKEMLDNMAVIFEYERRKKEGKSK